MLNKFALSFITAGLMVASAASGTYKVSILQDSVIDGKQVKAGDYKVEIKDNNTAVLKHGKQTLELAAKTVTAPSKFDTTEMEYSNNNNLQEIRFGGTNTKLVFENSNGPSTSY